MLPGVGPFKVKDAISNILFSPLCLHPLHYSTIMFHNGIINYEMVKYKNSMVLNWQCKCISASVGSANNNKAFVARYV